MSLEWHSFDHSMVGPVTNLSSGGHERCGGKGGDPDNDPDLPSHWHDNQAWRIAPTSTNRSRLDVSSELSVRERELGQIQRVSQCLNCGGELGWQH